MSFNITCNNCGNEITIIKARDFGFGHYGIEVKKDGEEILIICSGCGQAISNEGDV